MLRLALWGTFSHLAKRDKLPSGVALLASEYDGSGSGSGIATEEFAICSPAQRKAVADIGGAPPHVPAHLPSTCLCRSGFQTKQALGACDPLLNLFADQTLRSLRECEFVRKAAFEKYTDTGIAKRIGGCDQCDVTPGL